jgi:hypothetical protein
LSRTRRLGVDDREVRSLSRRGFSHALSGGEAAWGKGDDLEVGEAEFWGIVTVDGKSSLHFGIMNVDTEEPISKIDR